MGNLSSIIGAHKIEFAPSNALQELLADPACSVNQLEQIAKENPVFLKTTVPTVGAKKDEGTMENTSVTENESSVTIVEVSPDGEPLDVDKSESKTDDVKIEESDEKNDDVKIEESDEKNDDVKIEESAEMQITTFDDKKDDTFYPLLFLVAKSGNVESARWLLKQGLDVAEQCNKMNALHFACIRGDLAMIDFLMERGLRPEQPQEGPKTPLEMTVAYGSVETLKHLHSKEVPLDLESRENGDITPMEVAVSKNRLDMVECLMDCGVEVNLINKETKMGSRMNVPEMAVANASIEILRLFHKRGIDLNMFDSTRLKLTHLASHRGLFKTLAVLIELGVDCNVANDDGFTPLILASRACKTECVTLLLKEKVDLDAVDKKGNTALYYAAKRNGAEIVERLLEAGADSSIASLKGRTPKQIAQKKGCNSVIIALNILETTADRQRITRLEEQVAELTKRLSELADRAPDK